MIKIYSHSINTIERRKRERQRAEERGREKRRGRVRESEKSSVGRYTDI